MINLIKIIKVTLLLLLLLYLLSIVLIGDFYVYDLVSCGKISACNTSGKSASPQIADLQCAMISFLFIEQLIEMTFVFDF